MSGVQFHSQPSSTTVPALSTHRVTLSGIPLEAGLLTVRGCYVQLQGGVAREFVLPLLASEPNNVRMSVSPFRISHSPYDADRIKFSGLEANPLLRLEQSDPTTPVPAQAPQKFLHYQVVPEQPLLRVRRSSITQGSLMLFDGE